MTELPQGWAEVRIDEAGTLDLGRQRSPKYHSGPNMKPYLRVANVFEDRIDTADVKTMHFEPEAFERSKLHVGDVLLNEGQSPEWLGRPAIYRGDPPDVAFTNSLIRFKPHAAVRSEWALAVFRHHMHSGRFARESRITTNIAHLSANRLAAVEFRVPPLAEQERIVAAIEEAFSKLDAGEAGLRAVRQLLKRMRESVAATTFRELKFEHQCREVCSEIVDCPHSTAAFTPTGRTCVDTTCIAPGRVVRERLRYVSEGTWLARTRRLVPQPGDVVFAREGTIGTAVCLPHGLDPCLGQRVMLLRAGPNLAPRFLEQALMAPQVRAQYAPRIVGSTAPHLNVRDVKALLIPVPPVDQQETLVAELDTRLSFVDACERAVDAGLARSAALRRSVLRAAFEGRLVPQDPSDEPASVLLDRIRAERAAQPAAKRRARQTA